MPFQSKSQMAWMFANKPKMAKEWAAMTPSPYDLPKKVKKKKGQAKELYDKERK